MRERRRKEKDKVGKGKSRMNHFSEYPRYHEMKASREASTYMLKFM